MQNTFFVILFLVLVSLIGYLTSQYHVSKDITQSNRNILTEGSVNVLHQMKAPIKITVFASKDNTSQGEGYRKQISDFISRFQRVKPDISVEFVSPAEEPKRAQDAGIAVEGELVIEYQKRSEHLQPEYAEQEMTNLLVRLSRTNEKPVMFLDGHGEHSLDGKNPADLGLFGQALRKKGFKLINPDLVIAQDVPANGSMLVIASPQKNLSAVEVQKIKKYLDNGGNLLWLLDDNNLRGLDELAHNLDLEVSAGMVIDGSASQYGVDPKTAFASQYGDHAITKKFMLRTMFPLARQVVAHDSYDNGWKVTKLIDVAPNGWLENNPKELESKATKAVFGLEDTKGPINIAVALERTYGKKGQRIVVVGNSGFLSNVQIENQSNKDLGLNIVNWLSGDDSLITIQPKPLKDMNINIPSGTLFTLLIFFPIFNFPLGFFHGILPIVLLVTGISLWLKRRKA